MSLLERIKDLCDKRETTFAALERDLSFGNGTIRRWDVQNPSIDKLKRVAEFFNVSVDYLIGMTDDNKLDCESCYLSGLTETEKNEVKRYVQFIKGKRE